MAVKDWFTDPNKRDILKMIGGAIAALVAAAWTYHTWQPPKAEEAKPVPVAAPPAPPPVVNVNQSPSATGNGVATAIVGNNNQVNVGKGQ